ncbi:PPC domain-containing DNA-binding protein [Pseudorhodoferax sp.]|uniref:PPC domain-containing DNA-binding protein n=1 Tax=Pseudorhodoferax sp. TaxID=1993553 RepID=UPI002DD6861E|nr:PPC domain-containing DNA-binding protein [Pseudorhodoferax sp.]
MATELRIEVLRLAPGEDLRTALQHWSEAAARAAEPVHAACVLSAVGSLTRAQLRYADAPAGTRIDGPLELLSLAGTLGRGGLHLHASVADAAGKVLGGHVMHGCNVRTTAEIVLGLLPEHVFDRVPDPATGYLELLAQRR